VLGRATGKTDTQDSPRPGLGGSHHLPPHSILCTSPRGPHPNGFLSRDSQVGILRLPRLGLLRLWGAITLCADLWLRLGLKQSCSPYRNFFNGMSHAICTHGNQVDSQLLVVGSQIVNLTLGPSFSHNLCFKCPNRRCKPILNIYVPIAFQWYKECFKPLRFDPCSRPLKIQESIETQTPKMEPLGSVRVHSLTPFHIPRSMLCDSRLPSWPATLQTFTLVASPRLGL
jgi:hypothetical protein